MIRIQPREYVHVLDTNENITKVVVGPRTYTKQDHEHVSADIAAKDFSLTEFAAVLLHSGRAPAHKDDQRTSSPLCDHLQSAPAAGGRHPHD